MADDDDGTSSNTNPARGCKRCRNGVRPGCLGAPATCACNPSLVPTNYDCPFLRWDTVATEAFSKNQSNPDIVYFRTRAV